MINNVTLMGRLTAEPDLKVTTSNNSVLSFSIAVDRNYTPKGQERQADFINCVAWRQTAEFIAKYFRKGQMIALVGELQTRSYDDRDGNKRYITEVMVSNVSFCGSKNENSTDRQKQMEDESEELYEYEDDELPF